MIITKILEIIFILTKRLSRDLNNWVVVVSVSIEHGTVQNKLCRNSNGVLDPCGKNCKTINFFKKSTYFHINFGSRTPCKKYCR
jgi:hypothetical protein